MGRKKKEDSVDIAQEFLDNIDATVEYEAEERKRAEDDISFVFDNNQWPEKTRQKRELAGRPCLTVNKLSANVKNQVGQLRDFDYQATARPVDTLGDPATASIYAGLIKEIQNSSHAKEAYVHAAKQQISSSRGYFRIYSEYENNGGFEQVLKIKRILNRFTVYFDSKSEDPLYRDAEWCAVLDSMHRSTFKELYPKIDCDEANLRGKYSSTEQAYVLDNNDSIVVAEYFRRKPVRKVIGEVKYFIPNADDTAIEEVVEIIELDKASREALNLRGGVILDERAIIDYEIERYLIGAGQVIEGPSPWLAKYFPVVPVLGEEVIVDGKRSYKSLITDAKDAQMLYNYQRSTVAEMNNLLPKVPVVITDEQIEGHETSWDDINDNPRPYVKINDVDGQPRPGRLDSGVSSNAFLTEVGLAGQEIEDITGISAASFGKQSNEVSGVAIGGRVAQSQLTVSEFTSNFKAAITHCAEILSELIPHYYDTQRVIRILGDDFVAQEITINQILDAGTENSLLTGKYDIVIDIGPSYQTRNEEEVDKILNLVQTNPQVGSVIMDILVKGMGLRDSDRIAKRLKAMLPPHILAAEQAEEGGTPVPVQDEGPDMQQLKDEADLELKKGRIEQTSLRNAKDELAIQRELEEGVTPPVQ